MYARVSAELDLLTIRTSAGAPPASMRLLHMGAVGKNGAQATHCHGGRFIQRKKLALAVHSQVEDGPADMRDSKRRLHICPAS